MKKILTLLLVSLLLVACGGEKPDLSYEVESYAVDMSSYPGVKSTGHAFRRVLVSEVFRAIEEGGSGVFYHGYSSCPFCRKCVAPLNEVATDLGVTVYYIDAYYEGAHLTDEEIDKYIELLYTTLNEDPETGEKAVYTPQVFTIINGKVAGSKISMEETGNEEKDINKLKRDYRKLLQPFAS